MEKKQMKEVDLCLQAVDHSSVALVNPDQTIVVLYERRHKNDGYPFLCLINKIGENINTEDALMISIKSFCEGFHKSIQKQWTCFLFKDLKIITDNEKSQIEKLIEDTKKEGIPLINSINSNHEVTGIFI